MAIPFEQVDELPTTCIHGGPGWLTTEGEHCLRPSASCALFATFAALAKCSGVSGAAAHRTLPDPPT
eukprot:13044278-Alexandrium_andersonii.AAC.1